MTIRDNLDLLMLLALFVGVVCLIAPLAGGLAAWAREEWRLVQCKTWQGDYVVNPALGSMQSDRVAKMVLRQRAFGKRLRRAGGSLISKDGKPYVPVLTKTAPAEERPPRADKVVPIRHTERKSA